MRQEPGRTDTAAAQRGDPSTERPIGGDHHHLVPLPAVHADLLHDGVVAHTLSVDCADCALLTGRAAMLGGSLEDQDDELMVQVSRSDRLMEPLRRARAITPPARRTAADHVRGVNDEHTHDARVCGSLRSLVDATTARRRDLRVCRCAPGPRVLLRLLAAWESLSRGVLRGHP